MLYVQKEEIMIKNYQKMMTLKNDLFECYIDDQLISIQGQKIAIRYFAKDEILLKGQFSQIKIL